MYNYIAMHLKMALHTELATGCFGLKQLFITVKSFASVSKTN